VCASCGSFDSATRRQQHQVGYGVGSLHFAPWLAERKEIDRHKQEEEEENMSLLSLLLLLPVK
jgi:hypothetical protein